MAWLGVVLLLIVLAVAAVGVLAQRLVGLRDATADARRRLEPARRQRHDLVAPLLSTVSASAPHERAALAAVREAHAAASDGPDDDLGARENALTHAVDHLVTVALGYPDLRTHQRLAALHREHVQTTEVLVAAGRRHDEAAAALAAAAAGWPGSWAARMRGISPVEPLELVASTPPQRPQPHGATPADGRRPPPGS